MQTAADGRLQDFLDDLDVVSESLRQSRTKPHEFLVKLIEAGCVDRPTADARFDEIVRSATATIRALARSERPAAESSIPKIVHRIWLTSDVTPFEPPTEYVDRIIAEAKDYAAHGWKHYLWIQDVAMLPATVARIRAASAPIDVVRIQHELPGGAWTDLYAAFLKDKKFPFAADILRMKILYEFGGVYADMGARFTSRSAAETVVGAFDYALIFWETMFFQNSLMAMPKRSIVAELFLGLAGKPYTIPRSVMTPLNGLTEGMAFSGLPITAILLRLYDSNMRVCPLAPNARVVFWSSQQSWYTRIGDDTGKHGNRYVPTSSPSFFEPGGWAPDKIDPDIFRRVFRTP